MHSSETTNSERIGMQPATFRSRARQLAYSAAILYTALLLAVSLAQVLFPQPGGALALAQIFALYFFFPLVLLIPFAFLRGALALRLLLLACLFVAGARFPSWAGAFTSPANPSAIHVSAIAWNVAWGGQPDQIRKVLTGKPVGIVSLEEIDSEWIEQDEALLRAYPYRITHRRTDPAGLALLSVYPIIEHGSNPEGVNSWNYLRLLWARLDIGLGRTLVVISVHPVPPRTSSYLTTTFATFDPAVRDGQLGEIRALIDRFLAQGDSVLALGDFNVTDREPAYRTLSSGLHDAHRAVGLGLGHTWGPPYLVRRGLPIIRIDYLFSSPDVAPLSTSTDCIPRGSDHCIIRGVFEMR